VQKQLHLFLNSALDWVRRDRSVGTTVGLDDYHSTDTFHTPTENPTTIYWGKQAVDQLLPLLCYSQSRPNSNGKVFDKRLIFIYPLLCRYRTFFLSLSRCLESPFNPIDNMAINMKLKCLNCEGGHHDPFSAFGPTVLRQDNFAQQKHEASSIQEPLTGGSRKRTISYSTECGKNAIWPVVLIYGGLHPAREAEGR
jgi:hypothetical protein